MTRLLVFLVATAGIAGCTTYKLWTEYGENQDEGTVQLSYEYRKFENPQVDDASVLMERQVRYDYLIQVMDAIRTAPQSEADAAAGVPRRELFTNIAVGEAP